MASEAHTGSSTPTESPTVVHDGKRYTTVKEGLAHILVPETVQDTPKKAKEPQEVQQVFYNPIQQFNRDLTVLVIKAHGKEKAELRADLHRKVQNKLAERKRKRAAEGWVDPRSAKAPKTSAPTAPEPESKTTAAATDGRTISGTVGQSGDKAVPEQQNKDTPMVDVDSGDDKTPSLGKFTILDALSATGLRALRYAHEIPFVTSVTSNDLLESAVKSIKLNVEHNKLESKINVTHDNAISHMYNVVAESLRLATRPGRVKKSTKYDVVDLDPYGTAAPFLDAAVQSVRDDGGLLCVTCTDAGVWASSSYPEKAYSLYGGIPMKGGMASHEGGLRLMLHAIESSAAKYGLAMEPLLSLSIDFYARIFVRIRKSPANVKFQAAKNMVVYNCDTGCGAWTTQLLARNKLVPDKKGLGRYKHVFAQAPAVNKSCEHCGSVMHLAGPMYAGRLHSPAFIKRVLAEVQDASPEIYATAERARGMLQTALEEFLPTDAEVEELERRARKKSQAEANQDPSARPANVLDFSAPSSEAEVAAIEPYPFFFIPTNLAGSMQCLTPSEAALRGALIGLGYRVTRSHCKPGSIKTDAPWSVIWNVMREWSLQKAPVKEENIKEGSPSYRLLQLGKDDADKPDTGTKVEVVFDEKLGRDPTKGHFVRYQLNPRDNWGPMNKAKGH
jgi:tRNA (guanine26-N2/guanine27-N2)-dimethyltransferase